jgi:hypothetical protein
MGKRLGRKRKENVARYECGKIKHEIMEIQVDNGTSEWKEVAFRERVIDGKAVTLIGRQTALEALVAGIDPLEAKRLTLAAEEFDKLWHLCRRHYFDAPSINPKISSPNRGHGHEGELSSNAVEFGKKCHERYQEAIKELMAHVNGYDPHTVIKATLAFVIENKEGTSRELVRYGLAKLADFWGY